MKNKLARIFSAIKNTVGSIWGIALDIALLIVVAIIILNCFGIHIGGSEYSKYEDYRDIERY